MKEKEEKIYRIRLMSGCEIDIVGHGLRYDEDFLSIIHNDEVVGVFRNWDFAIQNPHAGLTIKARSHD